MKFLFYIFNPVWEQGGTMVMHELSRILCELGEDVYLTITETKLPENPSKIVSQEEAFQLASQDDCVTIYPEIISGNPLGAKHVVRWVLYYPGGHGVGDVHYHESEYVFTYHNRFVKNTVYESAPILKIFQSRADKFFDMNKQRTQDAVLIRKGRFNNFDEMKRRHVDPYMNILNKNTIVVDSFINNVSGFEQLNEIFNEFRYFVSFDSISHYSVLAALAGCISIVVPTDGVSKEQWKADFKTHSCGIAYGFDDLHWAMTTYHKTREYVLNLESENVVCAKNLIKLTKEKWNIA